MTSRRTFMQSTMLALPAGCLAAPAAWADRRSRQNAAGEDFDNVPLLTHEGRQVRFYDDLIRGRCVMFNMMYASCTNICPPNTANLLQVQQALGRRVGRDVFMYSITLRPETDSPEVLRDYMRQYGIGPGWQFLTGSRQHIDLVRKRLGFFKADPAEDANLALHTGMIRLGHDARKRWSMVPALAQPRQILNSIHGYL